MQHNWRNWLTPRRETWLHQVNPALKLVTLMLLLLYLFFSRDLALYVTLIGCFLILLVCFSGFSLAKLALLHIPLVLAAISSAASLLLFGRGDSVIWQWGILKISEESIHSAALIGGKTLIIGVLGLILLLTTSPTLLLYSLMQQLRLPAKYAYSFMAGFRLIPIMIEEIVIRSQAIKVRRVQLGFGPRAVYDRMKLYIIPLLAQSIRRAHTIAIAMQAKQFGQTRSYYYKTPIRRIDGLLILYVLISIVLSILLHYQVETIILKQLQLLY